MITIGLIGTGFGANVHIPALKNISGLTLIGVAGSDTVRVAEIAKMHGLRAYKSWKALIADPAIQAVSIATPPALHEEMAIAAAAAGKHIICEKPMAPTVKACARMLTAVKKAHIVHAIDFEFPFIPAWQHCKELLDAKCIGRIRRINIAWLTGSRAAPSSLMPNWKTIARLGGGILPEYGSHILNYVEWFFGPIAEVFGTLTNTKRERKNAAADSADLILKLKTGVPVNVSVSNVVPGGHGHSIEVYGDTGSLKLINANLKDSVYGFELLYTKLGEDIMQKLPLPPHIKPFAQFPDGRIPAFQKLTERFITAIYTHTNMHPSFHEGLRAQHLIDAIEKSNRAKRWVQAPS